MVLKVNNRAEFLAMKKLVHKVRDIARYEASSCSVCQILNATGFKSAKCSDGKQVLIDCSDIASVRVVFLKKMHKI
jgi:hypothetical protein